MITVIGLGEKLNELSIKSADLIKNADKVVVKTALTDTYNYFVLNNIANETMDKFYESSSDFSNLDENIVNYLVSLDNEYPNICYCVNGSGFEDRSVMLLAQKLKIEFSSGVSSGISNLGPNISMLKISSYELVDLKDFNYDTRIGLIVTDVDNEYIASEVKLILSNLLGDDEIVNFNNKKIAVFEIDRQLEYNYATTISCSPLDFKKKQRFNMNDLLVIMRELRSEHGCDWDKVQTHESIRNCLIEEAYELVDAINNNDVDNMIEETGDVLLQGVFHCVIGESQGEYNFEDATTGICSKLIFRHPHVFGDIIANNADEALKAWDLAKAKEKKYTSASSKIDSIAESLPMLMKTKKVQSIAKKCNFDFKNAKEAINKLYEEIEELEQANDQEKEIEGGDLLFAAVNVLRHFDVDPEVALQRATSKFVKRFKYVESHCDNMKDKTADELNNLWLEAKNATRED